MSEGTPMIHRESCPTCGYGDLSYSCHFSYGTWMCGRCGRCIDGRHEMPPLMTRAEQAELERDWQGTLNR